MIARIMAMPVLQGKEALLLRCSRWALLATIAGLPTYVLRWHYGPFPTTLLETLIVVTVASYVVARWRDGWRRPVSTKYDIPIVLLLIAGAVSVLVARDHRGALGLYRAFFVEPVAIFYVATDLWRRPGEAGRALVALAAGSSAFACLNLIVFSQALLAHQVHVGSAPNALYGDANYVAMYLEPPVALATGLVLFASKRWKWLGAGWLAITGLALLLSFSKGAYIAVCVVAFTAVLTARRWRIPLLAMLLAAGGALSRIPLIAERLSSLQDAEVGRFQIYDATFVMLRDHPILGLGLGGYNIRYRGFATEPYPHDIWLTFWVELGLLGLIAFAVILFGLLWRGWRVWPKMEGFYRPLLWGVLSALVLWTVHGLVDSPYWKNDMSVEFWMLAALELAAIASLVPREPTQGEHIRIPARAGVK